MLGKRPYSRHQYLFESKKISSKDDFYQKEENRVIKIALKFSELPDDDELISIRNPDNTVTIQKTINLLPLWIMELRRKSNHPL